MANKYQSNAKVFKALCDENPLIILEILQSGEKCVCHLLDMYSERYLNINNGRKKKKHEEKGSIYMCS